MAAVVWPRKRGAGAYQGRAAARASMWRRSFGRGNVHGFAVRMHFGMSSMWPRSFWLRKQRSAPLGTHGPGRASMWPRSSGRGSAFDAKHVDILVGASMWPGAFGRGNCGWRHTCARAWCQCSRRRTCFSVAAVVWPRKRQAIKARAVKMTQLQCGRGRFAAETRNWGAPEASCTWLQ